VRVGRGRGTVMFKGLGRLPGPLQALPERHQRVAVAGLGPSLQHRTRPLEVEVFLSKQISMRLKLA
jgi:hypothetical protein